MKVRQVPHGPESQFPVEIALLEITRQHRNVARVLTELEVLVETLLQSHTAPDFVRLAAMLHYLELFDFGIHQPVEEAFLFPAMRKSGAPENVINGALSVHNASSATMSVLQSDFNADRQDERRSEFRFAKRVPEQVSLERSHIAYEERMVLPCAIEFLPADMWPLIAGAFHAQDDPLFGANPLPEFAPLRYLVTDQSDTALH